MPPEPEPYFAALSEGSDEEPVPDQIDIASISIEQAFNDNMFQDAVELYEQLEEAYKEEQKTELASRR